MASAKRKGNRSKSGRLRNREPRIVTACEGVLRRQAIYAKPANDDKGPDMSQTYDAIGRAWSAGLLGQGDRAKELLDGGRKIAARYWAVFGFGTPDSLARFQPSDSKGPSDPEREKRQADWLNGCLSRVAGLGRGHRVAFDALVIDMNPDSGPHFLDALIFAKRTGRSHDSRDLAMLDHALAALEEVC